MRTLRWLYLTWRRWRDGGWREGLVFFTGGPKLSSPSLERLRRHYDHMEARQGIDGPTWTWPLTTTRPTGGQSRSGNRDDAPVA